jgi:hypothetical protein
VIENQTVKERLMTYIKYLGIGQTKFEARCSLSNGYVNNIRKSISPDKLQIIVRENPDLNPGWLMTGEGEMLRSTANTQNVNGSENFTQTGNVTIHSSNDDTLAKVLDELAAQRRMNEKSQEQIDRLISIIEKQ